MSAFCLRILAGMLFRGDDIFGFNLCMWYHNVCGYCVSIGFFKLNSCSKRPICRIPRNDEVLPHICQEFPIVEGCHDYTLASSIKA